MYIGVDPGKSGAIAIIDGFKSVPILDRIIEFGETERDVWKEYIDATDATIGGEHDCKALIEKVHSMPAQGVSSSFKFGMYYGQARMLLIASGTPFETVRPLEWQRGLGIPKRGKDEAKTAFKRRLKAKAQELFPDVKITLKNADALLIAEYCRRITK